MLSNFTVRAMTTNDIDIAYKIEQENYEFPWSYGNFQKAVEYSTNNYVIVDDCDGIFGFIILLIVLDECQLLNIAITKQYHKKGLGNSLLNYSINSLPTSVKSIWLEVKKSNIAAQKLYRNFAFKLVGKRTNYYKTSQGYEDALLFTKKLSSHE